MPLHIVILAAGQGKRMYSSMPKVLHPVGGKPMLQHVIDTAKQLHPEQIHVVVGHCADQIQSTLSDCGVNWVMQHEQLGTGHAVNQALPFIAAEHDILILSGDVPLIQVATLQELINSDQVTPTSSLKLLVAILENPFGLGRISRNSENQIKAVIEEKDANSEQQQIKEVYTGICAARAADLKRWLPALNSNNAQGEYYLTEIIQMAAQENMPIFSSQTQDEMEILGINNRAQLQSLERALQSRRAMELMLSGITIADANRIDIRGNLECGKDVFIDVNNVFIGNNKIGANSSIGPNCQLTNVILGENCTILANSVLEDCVIENFCQIGPFARIRPGTKLNAQCKIGNFVEAKNITMGMNSKANHLTYLGDAIIGNNVNIGAGTITCNYDGANKHQTIIENGVNIGSDTQLVAPVTVGEYATIGAGSTIRKNVPPRELTLTVSTQKTIDGWKRPIKRDKHDDKT